MKTVILKDGTPVPAVDQGTWFMGEKPAKRKDEIAARRVLIRKACIKSALGICLNRLAN